MRGDSGSVLPFALALSFGFAWYVEQVYSLGGVQCVELFFADFFTSGAVRHVSGFRRWFTKPSLWALKAG